MRGLGKNIRFMTRMLNEMFFTMLGTMGIMAIMFGIIDGNIGKIFAEFMPMWISMIIFVVIMINSINGGDAYLLTAVSMGSTRRQSGIGAVVAQHILLLEMAVLLGVCALLIEENKLLQAIRVCPIGALGILLLLLGLGILISVVSIRFDRKYGAVAGLILLLFGVLSMVFLGVSTGFEMNVESFGVFNTPIPLLVGLVVDLIASYIYCRVVRTVDLKLA